MRVDIRCHHAWGETRCGLPAHHDSAHGALAGRAILHWINWAAPHPRMASTDWVRGYQGLAT